MSFEIKNQWNFSLPGHFYVLQPGMEIVILKRDDNYLWIYNNELGFKTEVTIEEFEKYVTKKEQ